MNPLIKSVIRSRDWDTIFERFDPYDKEIKKYLEKWDKKSRIINLSKKEMEILKKV